MCVCCMLDILGGVTYYVWKGEEGGDRGGGRGEGGFIRGRWIVSVCMYVQMYENT